MFYVYSTPETSRTQYMHNGHNIQRGQLCFYTDHYSLPRRLLFSPQRKQEKKFQNSFVYTNVVHADEIA